MNYAAFGLVMILFLLFEPQGLVGIWRRVQNYFLLWPFQQRPRAGERVTRRPSRCSPSSGWRWPTTA
mgnify:CR=1 FL=1